MTMKQVLVRMPAVLLDEIRESAAKSDRSLSAEIRRAVRAHLDTDKAAEHHAETLCMAYCPNCDTSFGYTGHGHEVVLGAAFTAAPMADGVQCGVCGGPCVTRPVGMGG